MNICFYVKTNNKVKGGIEKLISTLCNYLVDNNKIYIIVDAEKWEKFPYKLHKDVVTFITPFRSDYFFINDLKNFIKCNMIDIVVVMRTGGNIIQIFSAALNGLNCKLIMSEHCAPEFAKIEYPSNSRDLSIRCSDYIHLLQDNFVDSIPKYMRNRVEIIGNFVDIYPKTINNYNDRKNNIVMVGRLTKTQKRPLLLLDAFIKLKYINRDIFNDWKLIFCGEGPEKIEIERIVKKNNIKNIQILGQIEDVVPILLNSKFFCLPSAYEGQSIALLEAMRCGTIPIVCNDSLGNISMIENEKTGYIVNKLKFAEDLAKILINNKNQSISKNTYEESLKYSPGKILVLWEKFFNKIIKEKYNFREAHLFSKEKAIEILINSEILS